MHVSLSEIEATVCKAAWGVGLALGLGEEAGRAARRLVVQGLAPLGAYADALDRIEAGGSDGFDPERAASGHFTARSPGKDLSALHAGPAARDLLLSVPHGETAKGSSDHTIVLSRVDLPLLILAELLAASDSHDGVIRLSAGGAVAGQCCQGRLAFTEGTLERLQDLEPCDLTIGLEARSGDPAEPVMEDARSAQGLEIEAETWRRLTRLADRRLVEASETSRLQGAGAGLVDRD